MNTPSNIYTILLLDITALKHHFGIIKGTDCAINSQTDLCALVRLRVSQRHGGKYTSDYILSFGSHKISFWPFLFIIHKLPCPRVIIWKTKNVLVI